MPDPNETRDKQLEQLYKPLKTSATKKNETMDKQLEQLFKPLNIKRIKKHPHSGYSYLEAWDVIAHLTRIFGPLSWDKQVTDVVLVHETEKNGRWTVAYRATVRLTIRPTVSWEPKISEDVAVGQAINQPSRGDAHDLALKTAVSDALKRAAKDLGNQFGLSLYDNGGLNVIGSSLAHPGDEPTE